MKTISKNKNKRHKNAAIIKAVYGERAFDIVSTAAEVAAEQFTEGFCDYNEWYTACQRQENAIIANLITKARIEFAIQQPKDNIGRKLFYKQYAPARTHIRRALKNELIKVLCNKLHNVIIKDVEFYISQITSEGLMYYNGHIYSITRKCWIK